MTSGAHEKTFNGRDDYIRTLFAPETPALQAVRAALSAPEDRISISPQEGKLLQLLIRMAGIKTVVEIGTLGGYSALWMAEALPAGGKIFTLEKDPARAHLARTHFAKFDTAKKITLVEGDAAQTLAALSAQAPFDMVFIDADKISYAHYLDWAEENIRTGGLIVGDNTFLFGTVWQDAQDGAQTDTRHGNPVRPTAWHAMRDFNARLSDAQKYQSILLPTQEGLTVALKLF